MSEDLKACPFCGSEHVELAQYNEFWYVKCENGTDGADLGKSGAAEQWNTRPIEDALRAENERLRKALDAIEKSGGASMKTGDTTTGEGHSDCIWIARRALKGDK